MSKVVTVDVRGSWQRWLKVRDLIKGATYTFSAQALTVSYGPAMKANITAQPVQGRSVRVCFSTCVCAHVFVIITPWERIFKHPNHIYTDVIEPEPGQQLVLIFIIDYLPIHLAVNQLIWSMKCQKNSEIC